MEEEYEFKAEINELMNMIINNFYSNRDIFLRELISNSSDAIDKLRYNSISDKNILQDNFDFDIKIKADSENKILTIEDSGIGMSKEELKSSLGTIAKSGTKEFIKKITTTENSSNSLIGQFGVGFYSAYLIANKVSVISKLAGSDQCYLWESSANGSYILKEYESDMKRGTKIIMYMKDDAEEYLKPEKLTEIIKKHSSYITYPIYIHKLERIEEEVDEAEEEEGKEGKEELEELEELEESNSDKVEIRDVEEVEKLDDKKKVIVEKEKWEKINSEPIWNKNKNELNEEDYNNFYKNISGDWDKPQRYNHFKVEGNNEFTGLIYIPGRAPFDLFENKENNKNIKLYVKKVLISDNCKDLCPGWLNFVSGIVDSNDLPLNASRELLQESIILKKINKQIIKKSIEMIEEISENKEEYKKFYDNFDKNIKLGINDDSNNRDKLVHFLRYSTSQGEMVSLNDYVERMKEGQPGIYFIAGESRQNLESSPLLEKIRKKDWEIIYMTDAIDEYIIQHLKSYKEVKLINISKDNLEIKEDEEEQINDKEYEGLCKKIKDILGDKVDQVKVSNKVESHPAIITNPMGISANMERIMKAQALGNQNSSMMYATMMNKRSLEINPKHNLMKRIIENDNEELNKKLVEFIYESSLLSSGYQLDNMNNYIEKVYKYLE